MKTITNHTECSLRELGSKFFGFLCYCETEHDFKNHLSTIKAKYPDASHHCYAYRINPSSIIEFSSDDGEPSGTAGLPILNQLKSSELVNVGAIVVRYFGGTRLGKAGLISTYGGTAKLCIDEASFQTITAVQLFSITYPYSEENVINKLKLTFGLKEQESEYLSSVQITFACLIEKSDALLNELDRLSYLNISYKKGEESFINI